MSLDSLKKIAYKKSTKIKLPEWVDKQNSSFRAFECINSLKVVKTNFIKNHSLVTDFKKKGNFQITATEIAKCAGISVPTLIATSSYSKRFKAYLDKINRDLNKKKRKKLQAKPSKGIKQRKKNELVLQLRKIQNELNNIKKSNAKDQAAEILKNLPNSIKRKLGLDC